VHCLEDGTRLGRQIGPKKGHIGAANLRRARLFPAGNEYHPACDCIAGTGALPLSPPTWVPCIGNIRGYDRDALKRHASRGPQNRPSLERKAPANRDRYLYTSSGGELRTFGGAPRREPRNDPARHKSTRENARWAPPQGAGTQSLAAPRPRATVHSQYKATGGITEGEGPRVDTSRPFQGLCLIARIGHKAEMVPARRSGPTGMPAGPFRRSRTKAQGTLNTPY